MKTFSNLVPIGKKSALRCPDCQCFLSPYRCGKTQIYKCDDCDGIWFDERRIGQFKGFLEQLDLTKIVEFFSFPEKTRIQISVCPRCSVALDEFRYAYNSGAQLKRCYSCEGLWSSIEETIQIIRSAKVSQEIAEDVKGLSVELEKSHHENDKIKKFIQLLGNRKTEED